MIKENLSNTAALTRAELINGLVTQLNFDKQEATYLVSLFFDEIVSALTKGESVHLSGFGNFDLKDKKARLGRNPKTGKKHNISARRVVTFRAGIKLKKTLRPLTS